MATLTQARLSETERRVIDRFVERLRERFGAELVSVWLYGSRARGESTGPESDVDLLVVTRGGRRRDFGVVIRVLDEAAEQEGASPPFFSVVVWDPARLQNRREIESFFVQEVDRDKVVLYGEP